MFNHIITNLVNNLIYYFSFQLIYSIQILLMSYSDQQVRNAVDAVFSKYDTDKSNSLDINEVTNLINDALKHMKANR